MAWSRTFARSHGPDSSARAGWNFANGHHISQSTMIKRPHCDDVEVQKVQVRLRSCGR